ncbi:hypothetical protein BGZ67_009684 [Mortierella alpina]|nr:hypothetical protein BGZ67_009684 [Mortierella alpina]
MSTSSTPHQQTVQEEEAPTPYQSLLEHAQSKLAHFQELLSHQEQRQLDTERAYKQRIDELRKDLRATKQELLEDCVQGRAVRAASGAYALKQQRQHLQDENDVLRASLRSTEEELTKVSLRIEILENRTRRMSQELQTNDLLKAKLLERHLADTILESHVERLMDVDQGIIRQCVQDVDADSDSDELDDRRSIQPSYTLLEELQNACSDSLAPAPSHSGMPESTEILKSDGQMLCSEVALQVASVSSSSDCRGPPLSNDQVDLEHNTSDGFSFTAPAKFLTPTAGNADQLVRVLGHYLHQHYQHAVGGWQEQQYNPFSWFIKTSAIVTISWAAMTMQMLSVVETLVGDVEKVGYSTVPMHLQASLPVLSWYQITKTLLQIHGTERAQHLQTVRGYPGA